MGSGPWALRYRLSSSSFGFRASGIETLDFRFWTLGFKLLGVSFLVFWIVHLGILDFGLWTLDFALCAFDFELWTWGFGFRSLDFRFWTLGFGGWPLDFKLCTLDSGL